MDLNEKIKIKKLKIRIELKIIKSSRKDALSPKAEQSLVSV